MLSFVQLIDLSDFLTSDELARKLGVARTTVQRRVARGDLVPDVIAPHGVLYWHPQRDVGQLDESPQPP